MLPQDSKVGLRHHDLPAHVETIAHRVIGCAIEVHRTLGAGLLESLYEEAMVYELRTCGLSFQRQKPIEVSYKDTVLKGQRIDLVVADLLVLELKSAATLTDLHVAQTLGYLRAIDAPLGLLLNFNAIRMTDGLKRVLNARWSGLRAPSFAPAFVSASPPPSLPSLLR